MCAGGSFNRTDIYARFNGIFHFEDDSGVGLWGDLGSRTGTASGFFYSESVKIYSDADNNSCKGSLTDIDNPRIHSDYHSFYTEGYGTGVMIGMWGQEAAHATQKGIFLDCNEGLSWYQYIGSRY